MRFLVVLPFSFYQPSGSSLSCYYRLLAISELDIAQDIICYPHGEDVSISHCTIKRLPNKKFFHHLQPGEYFKKSIYDVFLLFGIMKKLRSEKYDGIILHGSSIFSFPFISWLYDIKKIGTIHGTIRVDLEKWEISKNNLLKRIATWYENLCYKAYDHLIVEHQSILDNLEIKVKKKSSLINISVKSCAPINRIINNDYFNVLYTGTFVEVQNLDLIYKTARLLKKNGIIFNCVGGIQKEIDTESSKIHMNDVGSSVKLHLRLPQEHLIEFYQEADIVISPRIFGNDTPMKIFDYMNLGKCILASDRPIHREILNDNIAILAEPTPESFAYTILNLLNHPETIKEKELNAKKHFEENFGFQKMVNSYKNVFDILFENK